MRTHDLPKPLGGMGEIAGQLAGMLVPLIEGEPVGLHLPILAPQRLEIDRPPVNPRWRSSLEAFGRNSKIDNSLRYFYRRPFPGSTGRNPRSEERRVGKEGRSRGWPY